MSGCSEPVFPGGDDLTACQIVFAARDGLKLQHTKMRIVAPARATKTKRGRCVKTGRAEAGKAGDWQSIRLGSVPPLANAGAVLGAIVVHSPLSVRMSACVKGFGRRPQQCGRDLDGGRRPKASKGGNRVQDEAAFALRRPMGIWKSAPVCRYLRCARQGLGFQPQLEQRWAIERASVEFQCRRSVEGGPALDGSTMALSSGLCARPAASGELIGKAQHRS